MHLTFDPKSLTDKDQIATLDMLMRFGMPTDVTYTLLELEHDTEERLVHKKSAKLYCKPNRHDFAQDEDWMLHI